MTEAWPAPARSARSPKALGALAALAGAVGSGVALFLPWDRSCADLGRFAPGPVCSTVPGLRAGGVLAVALVVAALALSLAILALRGSAVAAAALVGLAVAGAVVALGAVEALDGSTWGVWPWIAGGGIQAGAHGWTLIRSRLPAEGRS